MSTPSVWQPSQEMAALMADYLNKREECLVIWKAKYGDDEKALARAEEQDNFYISNEDIGPLMREEMSGSSVTQEATPALGGQQPPVFTGLGHIDMANIVPAPIIIYTMMDALALAPENSTTLLTPPLRYIAGGCHFTGVVRRDHLSSIDEGVLWLPMWDPTGEPGWLKSTTTMLAAYQYLGAGRFHLVWSGITGSLPQYAFLSGNYAIIVNGPGFDSVFDMNKLVTNKPVTYMTDPIGGRLLGGFLAKADGPNAPMQTSVLQTVSSESRKKEERDFGALKALCLGQTTVVNLFLKGTTKVDEAATVHAKHQTERKFHSDPFIADPAKCLALLTGKFGRSNPKQIGLNDFFDNFIIPTNEAALRAGVIYGMEFFDTFFLTELSGNIHFYRNLINLTFDKVATLQMRQRAPHFFYTELLHEVFERWGVLLSEEDFRAKPTELQQEAMRGVFDLSWEENLSARLLDDRLTPRASSGASQWDGVDRKKREAPRDQSRGGPGQADTGGPSGGRGAGKRSKPEAPAGPKQELRYEKRGENRDDLPCIPHWVGKSLGPNDRAKRGCPVGCPYKHEMPYMWPRTVVIKSINDYYAQSVNAVEKARVLAYVETAMTTPNKGVKAELFRSTNNTA